METSNGFQDQAVTGGLDRFLRNLERAPAQHPAMQVLAEHGMLSVGYQDLDASRRERWVREAERLLATVDLTPVTPPRTRAGTAPRRRAEPVPVTLDSSAEHLRAVTHANAERLQRLGVRTVRDLTYLFPNRHLDYSKRRTVAQLQAGEEQTVLVSVWEARIVKMGRGGRMQSTEATVGDETGNLRVLWWSAPWMAQTLLRSMERAAQGAQGAGVDGRVRIALSGKVSWYGRRLQMESPEWELLEDEDTANLVHTGRLVPVYPSTEGLAARTIRRIVRGALEVAFGADLAGRDGLEDLVPEEVRTRLELMPIADAVVQSHYPDSEEMKELARQRLAFDELLTLQLAVAAQRGNRAKRARGVRIPPAPKVVAGFLGSLPFELTEGQRAALDEATADVARGAEPMSRLLQGDVGSGKTVVAVAMLLQAVAAGYQGVLMAPTEVLAEQHFISIHRLMSGLSQPSDSPHWFSVYVDGHPAPVSFGLLTGSTPAAARRALHARAEDGTLDVLIGTHALIQDEVRIPKLALAVVDEQHRFGVMQRAALRAKGPKLDAGQGDSGDGSARGGAGKGREPHVLVMSATPIPRSLALTLYGDLDVSTMRELPAGRQAVTTRLVPPARRADAEQFLVDQARQGHQSFVVCPLIEESEAVEARAATDEYERLRTTSLASVRVGLLHGRIPLAEKQKVMESLRANELDVLVATSVIEVGIDVPNATVMLIEGAERFGLAQLHQLRGRVGRGAHQSYCFLVPEAASEDAMGRLEELVRSNDGFEIAEADLRLRGPGDFFGTRQSGMPTLRMARLSDQTILTDARDEARALLAADPSLKLHAQLAEAVERYTHAIADEVG